VPVTTSPDNAVRLFTIKEAAEVLRIPISWLYERTRRNAIPYRRIGKYPKSGMTRFRVSYTNWPTRSRSKRCTTLSSACGSCW